MFYVLCSYNMHGSETQINRTAPHKYTEVKTDPGRRGRGLAYIPLSINEVEIQLYSLVAEEGKFNNLSPRIVEGGGGGGSQSRC